MRRFAIVCLAAIVLVGAVTWSAAVRAQDAAAPPADPAAAPVEAAPADPNAVDPAAAPPVEEIVDPAAAAPATPPAPVSAATAFSNAATANGSDIPWGLIAQFAGYAFLLFAWSATGDWVNSDSQIFALGYKKWNPIVFFPVAVLFIALAFVPIGFVIRFPILLVVYLATIIPYVVIHNKSVQPHQTVLTGSWWRHFFASMLGKVGVKVKDERGQDYEKGAKVDLIAMGAADKNSDNANLLTARQSPGYLLVKDLVADMTNRRVDRTLLEYGPQAVAIKYEIDGVWHPGEPRDRESADVMLAVMKLLGNLDPKERRKKQEGKFGAVYEGKKLMFPLACQGVANGERVVLSRLFDKGRLKHYDDLGMREGIKQQWEEIMSRDKGFVVFSAMPGGGLTTLTDVSIEETDRLMRDFFSIEEVNRREHEIQNVTVHTYDASKGESPATLMPSLVRLYPNVYICRDLVNAESGAALLKEVPDERLVITCMPARDAGEALLRLLQMKLPQQDFAATVTAVLYQRMIRKLCPDCKVGYTPPPDTLKKLGIPPGKVQQLFRPPKPEEIEKPCQTCQQIGYVGRTGIFELLVVTDQMRQILATQPSLELLRKAARADNQRSLQEEGILLVAKGVTSLPELQRVLK
jgi:type II secretory ATPase GspE/PulE/Tfp pilus assembly ATPase PilB-like protein